MARRTALALALLGSAGLVACGSDDDQEATTPAAPAAATTTAAEPADPKGTAAQNEVSTIASKLQVPWGVAFLPGGDALVSERTTGRILRITKAGKRSVAMTVPGVAKDNGEGGLLGLAVARTYAKDKLVYAFYSSTSGDNRIARFKLGQAPKVLFKGIESAPIHNGGRLAFGPDGKLYVGTGDAGNTGNAQNRNSPNGKVLRLNPNGSIPTSNPFPGNPVWSLGHRNVQGLAFDAQGRLWAPEFGQNTFDEVNLIQEGKNYGWPTVEGKGTGGGRFVSPKVIWRTSESSPSGAAIVKGNLYVGALAGRRVWKIPLDGTKVGTPAKLLDGTYGRLRSPVAAPDGSLWVTTSNRDGRGSPTGSDDRIVRLSAP